MKFLKKEPKQSLNKAYLKEKVSRNSIELFKKNLADLLKATNEKESEEHVKNNITKFLYDTYYNGKNQINTKGRIDLAIYEDSKPVVIIEAKRPNSSDMVSVKDLNAKAMHELILYYLRERIDEGNIDIKYLIATNVYEWFVFDASVFDKLFYKNTQLTKSYVDWKGSRKASDTTDFFYTDIAAPFLKTLKEEIEFTWFDLRAVEKVVTNTDLKDDNRLISLFKVLSPAHLLKQSFANDSNSLDTKFYGELLHIIGLEEKKDGGKKLIQRKEKPDPASFLENVINMLTVEDRLHKLPKGGGDFGATQEERLFNVALELCITWINRILFLKLLEGQLLNYHPGNKSYRFLDFKTIPNYDELNKLFFQVLARKTSERPDPIREKFINVPYLNSSLFEISPLEDDTLRINSLDDSLKLRIHSGTVLKTEGGKKREGELPALQYLFEFLDAYDFSSEGTEEIQEENKSLINASVLGLIFEKINGYKDGSFFTPGFITMYMCRETIRRAVVQKFNEAILLTPLPPLHGGEGEEGQQPAAVAKQPKVVTVERGLPSELLKNARALRKNQTNAEELLWQLLRNRGLMNWKFRRQHPLSPGYILDFFCAETNVAIELDGEGHKEKEQQKYDTDRTDLLNEYGIRVIRFWNKEVLDHPEQVLQKIVDFTPLSPPSPPWRGAGRPTEALAQAGGEDTTRGTAIGMPTESIPFSTLTDIYNAIGKSITIPQANSIINSLKICDPAVGSGHFLVSALNEILAIKSELSILTDRESKVLRDYSVEVINDELIVSINHDQLFEYKPGNKESQRVQEALFHEKQTLIENCLFGVDINPNSVKICRLRLWIELLKSAYYTAGSKYTELETLPNIDINIKQGNSLISRFALDADLGKALKSIKYSIDDYRAFVNNYKNATDKDEKRGFEALIEQIKKDFRTEIGKNDPKVILMNKRTGELYNLLNQVQVFEPSEKEKKEKVRKKEKLESEINKLAAEIREIKESAIFKDAFEWRFEFPEVLSKDGGYTGFDILLGNPPYISIQELKLHDPASLGHYKNTYITAKTGNFDIYQPFVENKISLLKQNGIGAFILPSKFFTTDYGEPLRKIIHSDKLLYKIIDFGHSQIFDNVTTYTCILILTKTVNTSFTYNKIDSLETSREITNIGESINSIEKLNNPVWIFGAENAMRLTEKVFLNSVRLIDIPCEISRGSSTGDDKVFILEELDGKLKDEQGKHVAIEQSILRRPIYATDFTRYSFTKPTRYQLIFPYKRVNKEYQLIDEKELEANYPLAYRYLEDNKQKLLKRKQFKVWYAYSAARNLSIHDDSHLLIPLLADRGLFSLSPLASEKYTLMAGGGFSLRIGNSNIDPRYILALLNSKLLFMILYQVSNKFRGGYITCTKQYMEMLPMKLISTPNQNSFISLVDKILKGKIAGTSKETNLLEDEIDQLVYQLYGLTAEEIKIVEGSIN